MPLKLTSGHLTKTTGGHLAFCSLEFPICCDGGPPTSVTMFGATGCWSVFNGTFALTQSLVDDCVSTYSETPTVSGTPCASGYCLSLTMAPPLGASRTVYWHITLISIAATVSATDGTLTLELGINYDLYDESSGPGCGVSSLSFPPKFSGAIYERETCREGTLVGADTDPSPPAGIGTIPTSCEASFA